MSSELQHQPRPKTSSASLADKIKQHQRATGTFLLLDCSGSMDSPIAPNERAIDKLRKVARQLRTDAPTLRQVIFPANDHDDAVLEIASDIPEPRGMTPLAEAITYSAGRGAIHLIIVSDGMPNDGEQAIREATKARVKIDVCYVGTPGGHGEAFLRELARRFGGQCDTIDLQTPQLETKIRGFLSA